MGDYGIKIGEYDFDVKTTPTEENKKRYQLLSTVGSLIEKEKSASPSLTNIFFGCKITPDLDGYNNFGTLLEIEISNGGSGYTPGEWELVDVVGGDSNAKVYIKADSGGVVIDCFINTGGSGYEVGNNIATTGGSGSGFTINIKEITEKEPYRVRPLNRRFGTPIYIIYENKFV